jgi:hypothetical protein
MYLITSSILAWRRGDGRHCDPARQSQIPRDRDHGVYLQNGDTLEKAVQMANLIGSLVE